MSFVKLDQGLLSSSLWIGGDAEVIVVWVFLLLKSNARGEVRETLPAIAYGCKLSLARTEEILAMLASPDSYSRTPTEGGRRIVIRREPEFSILLVNYDKYRRKDHTATQRKRRQRARERRAGTACHGVTGRDTRDVTQAEVEVEAKNHHPRTAACAERARGGVQESDDAPAGFVEFWRAYPKRRSKGATLRAWKKIKGAAALLPAILTAINQARQSAEWRREDGRFIPYPATWLSGRRWEDDLGPVEGIAAPDSDNERFTAEEVQYQGHPLWRDYADAVVAGQCPVGFEAFRAVRGVA